MKVTLAFYEYPKARGEIDNWLKSIKEHIKSKTGEDHIIVELDYGEIVDIIPVNNLDLGFEALNKYDKVDKVLWFGRVPVEDEAFDDLISGIRDKLS